jgi:hypothetical protein
MFWNSDRHIDKTQQEEAGTPPIQYSPPLSMNQQVVGYNQNKWQTKLIQSKDSQVFLFQQNKYPLYSPHPVNGQNFDYWQNKMERSRFIWDPLPELVKLPVSGNPQVANTQYVDVKIQPPTDAQKKSRRAKNIADAIRKVFMTRAINQS